TIVASLNTPRVMGVLALLPDGRPIMTSGFDETIQSSAATEIFDVTANGGKGAWIVATDIPHVGFNSQGRKNPFICGLLYESNQAAVLLTGELLLCGGLSPHVAPTWLSGHNPNNVG